MRDAGVLIYVSPKPTSNYCIRPLTLLQHTPVIVHLLKRLKTGLPAGDFEFHVLCHDGIMAEKLPDVLNATTARLFVSKAPSRLEATTEFTKANSHLNTLLIFEENAIFPDCMLTAQALQLHRKNYAEGTIGSDYPPGLLPKIYQSKALYRLQDLELPDDVSADFASVMLKANQLFEGDDEAQDLRFKLLELTRENLPHSPVAEKLPARLLIEGSNEQKAADAVLQKVKPRYDSSEAYLYKEELLRIEDSTDVPFPSISAPRAGVIPILFATIYGTFSGAEQSFANLIIHLDRNRYQPFVVLPYEGFLSEKLTQAGVPVEIADFNFMLLKPQSTRYFDALIKKLGIRIIHINALGGDALALAAHYAGIPTVFHVRSFIGSKAPAVLKYAAKIVTVSEAVARDLRRSDLNPSQVQCIYNGSDLQAFKAENYDKRSLRDEAGIPSDAFVICLIARIAPQKRLEFLLEALPKVREKYPNVWALFVGEYSPSEAAYYERIQKAVDDLGLRNHVRFWGFEKDIAKVHALSDVLVNCTRDEPFGRSILEALSMGVPVVAPNRGGHIEMLRHGENALLFDADHPPSLATELIRLLGSPRMSKQLALNGLKTVQNFDINTHIRQISALYEALL